MRAGAEQRVERQVPLIRLAPHRSQVGFARGDAPFDAGVAHRLERRGRIAGDAIHRPHHGDAHLRAALAQAHGGDESIAAVVAGAAGDEGAQSEQRPVAQLDSLDDAAPGAPHQVDARCVTGFNRAAVQRAHVFGLEQQHEVPSRQRLRPRLRASLVRSRINALR